MRALFITVHYPPIAGTSSRAMGELSIAMANAGHQVDVLTIQPAPGHPVYRYSDNAQWPAHRNIRVHRIPMGPVNRLVARAMRPAKACPSQPSNARSPVHQLVDGVYQARRYWQLLAIPDASIDWLPSAILKARRLVRELDPEL